MLLASDMDGTVIPLDSGKKRPVEIADLREALRQASQIQLAYVTGRDLNLAVDGIKQFKLPPPNFIVGDVGTSIYRQQDGEWLPDSAYKNALRALWGGLSADDIREHLNNVSVLEAQEKERQSEFKASYYSEASELHGTVFSETTNTLADAGVEASIICSIDRLTNRGLVDILPPGVAKDYAVRFLQTQLGLPDPEVVFAGDSGNDLAVFLSGCQSIVVGNTPDSVKEQVRRTAEAGGFGDRIYFAEQYYAAGVLEGLRAFQWIS